MIIEEGLESFQLLAIALSCFELEEVCGKQDEFSTVTKCSTMKLYVISCYLGLLHNIGAL